MTDIETLATEFDAALSAASMSRRMVILRQITDLFLEGAASYSEDQTAVFGLILKLLIETVERRGLIELSSKLASTDNAPAEVICRLSRDDDIAIAGSILKESDTLKDADILEIAETKGPGHLLAIASRKQLSEALTDVLISRNIPDVLRIIAGNECFKISEVGYVKLIGQAKADKDLAASIANRSDVPAELQPFLQLALGRGLNSA